MKPIQLIPQNAVDRLLAGDAEILFAAFNHGLTVDVRWPHWRYPLLHGLVASCPKRVDEMVDAALTQGANVMEEFEGLTPLLLVISGWRPEHDFAAKDRRTQCLQRLLGQALDIDDRLVAAAAGIDYADAIEALAHAGCGLESIDNEGQTALHHAYKHRHSSAVQRLIAMGAHAGAIDHAGKTPLALLLEQGPSNNAEWKAEVERFSLEASTPPATSHRRMENRL